MNENIKKFLPLIFLILGVVVLGLSIYFVLGFRNPSGNQDQETAVEIAFDKRPVVSLTPSDDGHWLTLKVEEISIAKAKSLDYELLYTLPDGRTQGVPGTVDLSSQTSFERKLLLGSESSGKFRYDEGVEDGSLTIRLRDSGGKLLTRFSSKFKLQSSVSSLVSVDGEFEYVLDKKSTKQFFVVMESNSLPEASQVTSVNQGPFAIFSHAQIPAGQADGWQNFENYFFK